MGLLVGPTPWWQASIVSKCPEGTYLPDGSTIICKSGGTAWIVAPSCTQVSSTWNGTVDTLVGNKCCICEWSALETRLINCGFNPCDWFVPSCAQLQNPGYVCRTNWDSLSGTNYWSSTEVDTLCAIYLCSSNGSTNCVCNSKSCIKSVRAFRCVTY
jgi:hypothetical protein